MASSKIQHGEFKDYFSITIQGWMINALGLHGNKLLVYAAVYTYSMMPGSEFTGGEKVLSSLCNISIDSIRTILGDLASDRLIYVNEIEYKGKKCRTYRANFRKVYGNICAKNSDR